MVSIYTKQFFTKIGKDMGRIHLQLPEKNMLILFLKTLLLREGKGGRKKGRETSMCGCLPCAPYWGPGLQPRHVP